MITYYPVEETENTAQSRQTCSGAHWDSAPPCLSDEEWQLFPTLLSCTGNGLIASTHLLFQSHTNKRHGAVWQLLRVRCRLQLWQVGQRTSAQHVFIFNEETQEACRRSPGFHFRGARVDENEGCKMDSMRRHYTVTLQGLKAQLAQRASRIA